MSDKELIQSLGGASALARELGYEMPDGARRVHNWIKRGIPANVKVHRPDLFMREKQPIPVVDRSSVATESVAINDPTPPQPAPAEAAATFQPGA